MDTATVVISIYASTLTFIVLPLLVGKVLKEIGRVPPNQKIKPSINTECPRKCFYCNADCNKKIDDLCIDCKTDNVSA